MVLSALERQVFAADEHWFRVYLMLVGRGGLTVPQAGDFGGFCWWVGAGVRHPQP